MEQGVLIYYCCWNETQPRNRIMLLAGPFDGCHFMGYFEGLTNVVYKQSNKIGWNLAWQAGNGSSNLPRSILFLFQSKSGLYHFLTFLLYLYNGLFLSFFFILSSLTFLRLDRHKRKLSTFPDKWNLIILEGKEKLLWLYGFITTLRTCYPYEE